MGLLKQHWFALFGLLALACTPDFDVDPSLVDRPRVLALAATPAEAAPGDVVDVIALIGSPEGTLEVELDWALCLARRPLAELGPISPACLAWLDDGSPANDGSLDPLGSAITVQATVPDEACRLFGPEPPPAVPGQPTGRAVDPDFTGGYYQPVLATLDDGDATLNLLQLRLACGLAGATPEQASEFARRVQRNVAPRVVEFASTDGTLVAPGEIIELSVRWEACPTKRACGDAICSLDDLVQCPADCVDTTGCGGAETHLYFDPLELELDTRRESISVAWYVSAGQLDAARTGRGPDDDEAGTANQWRAPQTAGPVHAWVVVRDDRGAASWATLELEVSSPFVLADP